MTVKDFIRDNENEKRHSKTSFSFMRQKADFENVPRNVDSVVLDTVRKREEVLSILDEIVSRKMR